ncbi:MAG TPA: MFS transporter [Solirubrobacteraceae bacterium]|nr:MFS transporter [Solirubrobacteraceae bacterium]
MPVLRVLIAVGVGLALADASVVTLALPPMLIDLDTTVEGVAAVIGVYTFVLAATLPAAAWLRGRVPDRTLGVAGFGLFAVAGALCATPDAIGSMLAFRGVQAVGASGALVAGFALLGGDRLWTAAAIFGTAVGPALGGALTQAFDWRAIFFFQVPVALAAAAACLLVREGRADEAASRRPQAGPGASHAAPASRRPQAGPVASHAALAGRRGAIVALACLSAALTGVLFLLVLLLVSGWSVEPLAAAAAVSVLPVAALAGARIRGDAAVRASAGCALVGAGVLALAALPDASAAWIVAPQLLAGIGMGMALPALAGELLPERTPRQAAGLLSFRHAGITLALLALAPVAAAQLDRAIDDVREQGAALILDARLPPLEKVQLAGPLLADFDPADPRDGLRRALDKQAPRFADDPEQRREYAHLTQRADDALLAGIDSAFRIAFLIAGGLALVGAVAALPASPRGRTVAIAVAAGALALPVVHAVVRPQVAPEPVVIADPCKPRALPDTGGLGGLVQDQALAALDRAACRFGSSREELALALASKEYARAYQRAHGVDPRSVGGLLEALGINAG